MQRSVRIGLIASTVRIAPTAPTKVRPVNVLIARSAPTGLIVPTVPRLLQNARTVLLLMQSARIGPQRRVSALRGRVAPAPKQIVPTDRTALSGRIAVLQPTVLIAPTVPTAQPAAQAQIGPVAEPVAALAVRKPASQPVAPKALPAVAAEEGGVANAQARRTRRRKTSPQRNRLGE